MPIPPAAAANSYAAIARMGEQASNLGAAAGVSQPGPDFGAILKDAIDTVTEAAQKSDVQGATVATGKANMIDVVTAVAESETAIQTLVSVRDKVISAYEDILKMPI